MWIIVCRSPQWHLSEEVRHHFCRLAAHNPVFVRKRFSNDHVWRGNSKPGCRTVGSDTSALLTTIAEFQTSCHLVFLYKKWSSPTRRLFNSNRFAVYQRRWRREGCALRGAVLCACAGEAGAAGGTGDAASSPARVAAAGRRWRWRLGVECVFSAGRSEWCRGADTGQQQ